MGVAGGHSIDREVDLLAKWRIRTKLLLGLALLLGIVFVLAWSVFHGLYEYRRLIKGLDRVAELPMAAELEQQVSDLRVAALGQPARQEDLPDGGLAYSRELALMEFEQKLDRFRTSVGRYRKLLENAENTDPRLGDNTQELTILAEIESGIARLDAARQADADLLASGGLRDPIDRLHELVGGLPRSLQDALQALPDTVRDQYRRRIVVAWGMAVATAVLLLALSWLLYKSIFRPLRLLVKGWRKVAADRFDHRITVGTNDEMSELAEALNAMAARFQAIRDDLEGQVQERTRQAVRAEQLASLGFLAAGVAHEINNPLEEIRRSSEAVQAGLQAGESGPPDDNLLREFRRIHQAAFRCKEITQNLLDFSREGDPRREPVELQEVVQGVAELVRRVGRCQAKEMEVAAAGPLLVRACLQQIRQVVLNLVIHGLDSIDGAGRLRIELHSRPPWAEIQICGENTTPAARRRQGIDLAPMSTRRGAAAGWGLSISTQIIEDHCGQIEILGPAVCQRPGFLVRLPLAPDAAIAAPSETPPPAAKPRENAPHAGGSTRLIAART
jgi:signal transduction histidine kinase